MSTLRQTICKELKTIRKNEGLLQKQACDKMNIDRSHFAHLENADKNITIDKLENWANSLGYNITFKTIKQCP